MSQSDTVAESHTMACINGRWVPAIPIKAPIDVRWMCEHQWTPHVYEQGWDAWNFFDCTRCGAACEAANRPDPGAWKIRRWVAERIFPFGRRIRRAKRDCRS